MGNLARLLADLALAILLAPVVLAAMLLVVALMGQVAKALGLLA